MCDREAGSSTQRSSNLASLSVLISPGDQPVNYTENSYCHHKDNLILHGLVLKACHQNLTYCGDKGDVNEDLYGELAALQVLNLRVYKLNNDPEHKKTSKGAEKSFLQIPVHNMIEVVSEKADDEESEGEQSDDEDEVEPMGEPVGEQNEKRLNPLRQKVPLFLLYIGARKYVKVYIEYLLDRSHKIE